MFLSKLALAVMVWTLAACSETSGWNNVIDSHEPKQGESTPSKDNSDTTLASEPVSVGGAFLVCAADDSFEMEAFGCRLEDVTGEKLNSTDIKDGDLVVSNGTQAYSAVAIEGSESFWHWYIAAPLADVSLYTVQYVGQIADILNVETEVQIQHPEKQVSEVTMESPYDDRHLMFVTSIAYQAGQVQNGFNSLASADALCNQHALANGLPTSFKVILSTSTVAAAERIRILYPVYNLEGNLISNPNQFWTNRHLAAVVADKMPSSSEEEEDVTLFEVWTGTSNSGLVKGTETCADWTDNTANEKGNFGMASDARKWVDDGGSRTCESRLRLYCLSQ
ncbi:hypothetical protein [Pseudobacteriovorax antillogorgiicola]|uniref:DUF1554 domain-containing protein n=1 Tax=Pseudobacteriovorax antillogorgiicola TaxID=1513793 RepID=A0A1Y6BBV2_9BACT|nr:hypothetical protein [Pseudobacteriovorax antillogorgiicola]TCS57302.1 hypothetical protein EDD56_10342 [Pseudobacteriovorax antillogorgiicola]SMF02918.1 hypothetical protein SAMN06296036_103291 [Pseudobacteriovorax antillogorgiicola]